MGHADLAPLPEEVFYITSDHGLDYFVAINKKETQYPKMIEMRIEHSCGELKKRYASIIQEMHLCEAKLKVCAKYNQFMHEALVYVLNQHNLESAKNGVDFPLVSDALFVVQAWVPCNKVVDLQKLVTDMKIHIEEIIVEETDVVPTCLENSGAGRIGEDLVGIYDTPSNKDNDPSLWVLVFFALFFSMIIGDGGYGLVLLSIALYIRYKHAGLRGGKKRFINLLTILGFSCIAWGILTTSFFGIPVPLDSPFRKVSAMTWLVEKKAEYHLERKDGVYKEWVGKFPQIAEVKDAKEFLAKATSLNSYGVTTHEAYNKFADNIMMEIALLIGVIHLVLSMGRYLPRHWGNIGWIVFLIGAYLYVPIFLGAASMANFALGLDGESAARNGLYMIYGGISLAFIFAVVKYGVLGIFDAISQLIQIFGDVLSYLRLYALGLAGALLTATIIDLAAGLPVVLGIILLVIGHIVNITLGIMGGVIHGLRLNFLEWYHYSFEGGGKMFNPLRKLEIE